MAECDTANRKRRTLFSALCAWSAVPAWLLCGSGISTPKMGSQKEFGISRQRSILNLSFCFVVCAANAPMLLLFDFGKLLLHTRFARGMRRFGGDLSNHEITTTQGRLSICLNFTEYQTEDRPTAHGQRWSHGTHLGSDQSRLPVLKVNFFLRCALPCLQWLTRRITRGALSEAFLCFVKSASQLRPFFTLMSLVGGFSEDLALARFKETLPSKAEQQTKRRCGHFVPRMKQSHPRFCNTTSSRVSLSLDSWMFDDVQCGQCGQWVKIDSWTQLRIGPFGLCMNNRGASVPFGTLQQF